MFGSQKGKKVKIHLYKKYAGRSGGTRRKAPTGAADSGDACTPDGQPGNGAEADNDATTSGPTAAASSTSTRKRIRRKTTPEPGEHDGPFFANVLRSNSVSLL